jgi:hypothetical protein
MHRLVHLLLAASTRALVLTVCSAGLASEALAQPQPAQPAPVPAAVAIPRPSADEIEMG